MSIISEIILVIAATFFFVYVGIKVIILNWGTVKKEMLHSFLEDNGLRDQVTSWLKIRDGVIRIFVGLVMLIIGIGIPSFLIYALL